MNNMFKVNQTVPYDLRKRNVLQSRNHSSIKLQKYGDLFPKQ